MLRQIIALASIAREKLAEQDYVAPQKALLRELDAAQRVSLINRMRAEQLADPITEDGYFANEGRWVNYLYEHELVRPRWMTNV